MSWQYLGLSYLIGMAFMVAAVWLTAEWHWAARWPLLAYLAFATLAFPLSRLPAEPVFIAASLWSPIEITGIVSWLPRAFVYAVVWALGIIFAPIGAVMFFAGRRRRSSLQPD